MTQKQDDNAVQRAFITWLGHSKNLLSTPLTVTKQSNQYTELTFTKTNSMISALLSSREISVNFRLNNSVLDDIIYFKVMPELHNDYYICSLRYPDDETYYASKEALWEVRLFEPFLSWVNNSLTTMPWIEINENDRNHPKVKLLESKRLSTNTIVANPLYIDTVQTHH